MDSVRYLTDQDFETRNGKNGKILCIKDKSFSMVMFSAPTCHHCTKTYPIFKQLSSVIQKCTFSIVDLSAYPQIAIASRSTISPIERIPMIILYISGVPYLRYDGKREAKDIQEFVVHFLGIAQKRPPSSAPPGSHDTGDKEETAQAISSMKVTEGYGIPFNLVCDEDDCYVQVDTNCQIIEKCDNDSCSYVVAASSSGDKTGGKPQQSTSSRNPQASRAIPHVGSKSVSSNILHENLYSNNNLTRKVRGG